MQIYLGDKPLDYRGVQLGDINIQNVFQKNQAEEYADAFINAAGITDPTQQLAILELVDAMLAAGIWDRMYAVYPFVGGTATTHKYNLINPQDTNAAFRLSFLGGGWTHNSNGITPNGTTSYAATYYSPNTNGLVTNGSIGVYSRTNSISGYDMGAFDNGANQLGLIARYTDGKFYAGMPIDGTNTFTNGDSRGLFTACQTGGTNVTGYINATQRVNQSDAFPSGISNPIFIAKTYDSGTFSNRNYAFAFIGNTLNASQVAAYYTMIQAYQTTLGRQV